MNGFSYHPPQFRPHRLTLAEPGAEGGTGGGGPAPIQGTVPQLSQAVARAEMENRLASPDPNSDGAGAHPEGEGTSAEGAPPAGVKPDSEDPTKGKPPAEGEEGGEEPTDPEKRVSHAKAKMHAATTEAARLKKENEDLREELTDAKAKVSLANKYVDWDKLSAYDKEQMETELGRPLTRKDLEELKSMAAGKGAGTEPPKDQGQPGGELSPAEVDTFVEKFLKDNPHVLPYVDTGEAQGVVAKVSAAVEKELADKTPLERLQELGKRVGEFFRNKDAQREREAAERLTTRRTALDQAGGPRASAGSPASAGGGDDNSDDPSTYVAEREARRFRALNVGR